MNEFIEKEQEVAKYLKINRKGRKCKKSRTKK